MLTADTIITLVDTYGFWVIGIVAVWRFLRWCWNIIGRSLSDPQDDSFLDYQARLREDTWVSAYHRLLKQWLLTPLDRWLQDEDQQTCRPGGRCDRLFGIQPWTTKSYIFCLRLAIAYPLVMVFCVWLFGFTGRLGDSILLPATTPGMRLGLLIWLSTLTFVLYRSTKSTGWKVWGWIYLSVSLLIFGTEFFKNSSFVAIAATVGIAVAVGNSAVVVGAVIVASHAGLIIHFLLKHYTRHRMQLRIWLGYSVLILSHILTSLILASIFPELTLQPLSTTFLVFLGLLPLLNTLWDWCSLGLTRGLLAGIVRHKHPGLLACIWAFLDIVLALVFLLGIVLTITAALASTNAILIAGGSEAWFDLPGLLTGVRTAPGDPQYYWLYAMFVSTLLPTLLHALIAAASVIQVVNIPWLRRWRQRAADQLPNHSARQAHVQAYFFFIPLLAAAAPCALLYGLYRLLLAHGGTLGCWLLDSAEAIALLILPATT